MPDLPRKGLHVAQVGDAGTEPHAAEPASRSAAPASRRIEIGWITAGKLDEPDQQAARQALQRVSDFVRQSFPEFDWQLPAVHREELVQHLREEPVVLFDQEMAERDAKRWDFVILITAADFVSHYKPFALAVLSRSFEVAAISTARIDPAQGHSGEALERRIEILTRRIVALAVHALGHLNGLSHSEEPENYMYDLNTPDELDAMQALSESQVQEFRENLHQTADLRLEERPEFRHARAWRFYLQGLWTNRRDIASAVFEARPWQFPFRLSGLTTAALSVMIILIMTEEVWNVGTTQSGVVATILSLLALAITTAFVITRQRLLVHRDRRPLSELTVIRNVSTLAIVLSGMATTYLLLFAVTLLLAATLFEYELAVGWAGAIDEPLAAGHYLILAAFISSFGIFIGALGLSFENQHYFRHVTYVDEET